MERMRSQLHSSPIRVILRLVVLLSFLASLGVATWLIVPATETLAQTDSDQTSINTDRVVQKGEVVNGNVSVTKGNLTVHGKIDGNAVVLNGDVVIDGEVTGNATALVAGSVKLLPAGHVGGDVLANGNVVLGPGT